MHVMVLSFAAVIAAQNAPGPLAEEMWPDAKSGRILETPDWSDYRIYPRAALKKDEEGRVKAELFVGSDGKPVKCRILNTSFRPDLDAGTCELMMQMRFDSARDAAGKAIQSHYVRAFNWRLTDPIRFASGYLKVRVSVRDGRLRRCEIQEGAGPYLTPWSSVACPIVGDVPYYFGSLKSGEDIVEIRLDASDQADFLARPWTSGRVIASERIVFNINYKGDPSECTASQRSGFGDRGLNNLSNCGRFLSILWFASPEDKKTRSGTFETRVFFDD